MTNRSRKLQERELNPVVARDDSRLHGAKPRQSISPYLPSQKFVRRSIHSVVVPRSVVSETPIVTSLCVALPGGGSLFQVSIVVVLMYRYHHLARI